MKPLTSRLGIVLLSVALASCMVLPVSKGPFPDSRQNIAAEVPAFIASGATLRSDVLLRLGEPDGATEDERRFIYVKRIRTGGHEFVLCGVGPPGSGGGGTCSFWTSSEMAYDRLTIQFDSKNVVTSSAHERITCTEESRDPGARKSAIPCVDVANLDLILKTNGVVFPYIGWCRNVLLKGWDLVRASAPCHRGSLVISDRAILLYPDNANNKSLPILTLSYDEISNIEKVEDFLGYLYGIALTRADGSHDSIGGIGNTRRMVELLLPRWKAAAK